MEPEAPRRTQLAAERTWLAWWRTGLAAAAGALGIGRVLPELIPGSTWPYVVIGTGYGALALALMGAAALRQRRVRAALRDDDFEALSDRWVLGFHGRRDAPDRDECGARRRGVVGRVLRGATRVL